MSEIVPKIDTLTAIQEQTLLFLNQDRQTILAFKNLEKERGEAKLLRGIKATIEKEIRAAYGLSPENFLVLTDFSATRGCVFPLEFCANPDLQATVNRVWERTPENLLTVQEVLKDPDLTWDDPRVFQFFLAWEALMKISNPSILEKIRKEMEGVDDYTRILDRKIELLKRGH